MLIWMCALHCEAKPIIDYYRLRKLSSTRGLDLYQTEGCQCVVSGIGALNMASATAWTAAQPFDEAGTCWVNLGIAGHRDFAVGTPIMASAITSPGHRPAYCIALPRVEMGSSALQSLPDETWPDYPSNQMVDMEAYAFMHAATRFIPPARCYSLKVISDNALNPPHRDKQRISDLIAKRIDVIARFAHAIQTGDPFE